MSKKSRKSLQKFILDKLSRSRASKHHELVQDIEDLISRQETKKRKVQPKYLINRTIKKMINDEMIQQYETEQSTFLSLTSSGRQKLRNIKLSSQSHLISTTWDGYWRVVIVDIRDERKRDQDAIRYILKKAQFIQIKNSVWISPYPLEHMMINMKRDMGLHEELIILVTNKLDADTEEALVKKFSENTE